MVSYCKGADAGNRDSGGNMRLERRAGEELPTCQQTHAYDELMTDKFFFMLGSVDLITSVSFLLRNKYLITKDVWLGKALQYLSSSRSDQSGEIIFL